MKSISRFIVIILTTCLLSNLLGVNKISAQPVDNDQAKLVAKNFFADRLSRSKLISTKGISSQNLEMALIHEEKGDIINPNDQKKGGQTLPLYYVFNVRDNTNPKSKSGFIIVSADQRVQSVLGYSFSGEFQENDQAPAFKDWMDHYREQITFAIKNNLKPAPEISNNWKKYSSTTESKGTEQLTEVVPLVATTWDQDSPYNLYCPNDAAVTIPRYGGRVPAGCAAIAMAQIMKYWNYPAMNNPIPGYTSDYGLQPDVGVTTYDWYHMPNSLESGGNSQAIGAVAGLIYHCGVSVDMDYGPQGSGAGWDAPRIALRDYFKYSPNMQSALKSSYSNESDWANILRNELDNKRPVIYNGYGNESRAGGHAFVCDGYQNSEPFFHFNWGWDGAQDGYYYLNDLTPGSYQFNYGQWVLFGIEPPLLDVERNGYNTVEIGSQLWMAENLKTTRYNDGTGIPNITNTSEWLYAATGAYCWYNFDEIYTKSKYGTIYNWHVVEEAYNSGKNVCPVGWHVPTYSEFEDLIDFLDGWRVAGGKLKEAGTVHWIDSNTGTNESGFTALPGASRSGGAGATGAFGTTGYAGGWWSSTRKLSGFPPSAFYMGLLNTSDEAHFYPLDLPWGFNIRCLKGELPILSVTPNKLILTSLSGATGSFNIISSMNWTVTDDAEWLTLSSTSGTGDGSLTVTANNANTSDFTRYANVTFSAPGVNSVNVTVVQNAVIPKYVSSVIENVGPDRVIVNYSTILANIVPAASAFNVMVNTGARSVTSVTILETKVLLTLSSAVSNGDLVTVSYTKPSGNPLQTSEGGQAASISAQPVTNNVSVTSPVYTRIAIVNSAPDRIEIIYSLALDNIVPPVSAFNVTVNSVPVNVNSVVVSGTMVILTLASPVANSDVITVAYNKPFTDQLQTPVGIKAASISAHIVTSNVSPALSVTPPDIYLTSALGASRNINVTSTTSWTVTDDADWLTLSSASGSGNGILTVTSSSANASGNIRNATVTFSASGVYPVAVSVTQYPAPDAPVANNVAVTYDGISHSAGASVPSGISIVWYDAPTMGNETTQPAGKNYGTFSAYAEAVDNVTGCTSSSRTPVALTIKKAGLMVTAKNQSSQYSDPLKTLTYEITGFVNGETSSVVTGSSEISTTAAQFSAPGEYTITISIGNLYATNYSFSFAGGTYSINCEDASVTFTGTTTVSTSSGNPWLDLLYKIISRLSSTSIASTASASSGLATVTLRATIQDISETSNAAGDIYPGDIRLSKVRFVIKDGTPLTDWLTPILVIPSDLKTGVVSYDWKVNIGVATQAVYTIGIEVNNDGYYTNNQSDYTTVTIYKPTGDYIAGGGYINPTNSAGTYASDPGLKTNFGFVVTYKINGMNRQGSANIIFRRKVNGVVNTFQIKSNSITSLGVNVANASSKTAVFIANASLTEISKPGAPVSIAGNLTLQVNMTDKGDPGTKDQIAISLWNGSILLYSSYWNGASNAEMVLGGGNLVVHSGFSFAQSTYVSSTKSALPSEIPDAEFGLKAYPNPFTDHIYFDIQLMTNSKVQLEIYDVTGTKLATVFNNDVVAFNNCQVEYTPKNVSNGILFYRLIVDGLPMFNGKLIHY